MNLFSTYRSTLKPKGIEEYIDLILYRPLGFLLALLFKPVKWITPNVVTFFSAVMGIYAGFLISQGFILQGILLTNLAVILDCCDGQLARMTNFHSVIGRVLDGFVDYICFISLFLGVVFYYIHLGYSSSLVFGFAIVAGLSLAIQAASLDYYRNNYLLNTTNVKEIEDSIEHIHKMKLGAPFYLKPVLWFYHLYMQNQKVSFIKSQGLKISIEAIKKRRIYGTSMHIFLISVCLFLFKIEVYLLISMIIFNGYMFTLRIKSS